MLTSVSPKRLALAAVLIFVALTAFSSIALQSLSGARLLFPYPTSWHDIRVGDASTTVVTKCPLLDRTLHDAKGDFCYSRHLFGWWTLQVHYDDQDRVARTNWVLRVGTRKHFKILRYDSPSI